MTAEIERLKYVGEGKAYIQGVPARDILPKEFERYGGLDLLLKYPGVFQVIKKKEPKPAPAKAEVPSSESKKKE